MSTSSSSPKKSVLIAQNLVKYFKVRKVVDAVSLTVNSGEVIGLLGPNGAGKTTCFHLIVGLIKADSGSISINEKDITVKAGGEYIKVQKALDGQLITEKLIMKAKVEKGLAVSDVENDILKMVVLNRYQKAKPAVGFVNNFGFKRGAIASAIAHDSHNIIAIGTNDAEIVKAINLLIETKGGISLADNNREMVLPLPVAGIMSNKDGYLIADKYAQMDQAAKQLGSGLNAPYMTLSFMALLVIPELKLSDKGLFDGIKFKFTSLFEN